jgi:hypothetical protein
MELLGLAPGSSATERLAELTRGRLPEDAVRALVAATGMTAAQARDLAPASPISTDAVPELERLTLQVLDEKLIQPGGEDKTSAAGPLARLLAEAGTRRPLLNGTDPAHSLDGWPEPAFRPVLVDLPWLDTTPPADPGIVDEVLKELGIAPTPQAE